MVMTVTGVIDLDAVSRSCQYVRMHIFSNEATSIDGSKLREIARACACANLRKAARAVTQLFDATLAPSGLKATQFTLLVTSQLSGETTINGLAGRMAMDRTTLSRNLKPLVREGLLEVGPGEDGRTRLVRINPEGERALDEAYPMWQAAQEEVIGALGTERYEALLGDVSQAVALAADGSLGSLNDTRGGAA
jgi:DNA-binding MarR family transcriptional regulator